jgi:hypothetical protein
MNGPNWCLRASLALPKHREGTSKMDELLLAQSGDPDDPPPKLLLLLSALYRIARPAGSTTEYPWQWIIRDWKADQLRPQGRTPEGWEVSLLPSAAEKIDRVTGTLKESHIETKAVSRIEKLANIDTDRKEITIKDDVEIRHIKLRVNSMMRLGMLLPPNAEVAEQGRRTVSQIIAWLVVRKWLKLEEGEWPIGMDGEIRLARLELARACKEGLIRFQDEQGKPVHDLRQWCGITAEASEIARLYPLLISAAKWIHKAVERYAAAGTTGAEPANLNALVEFEANRPDWACFKERTKSIGGNLDNSVLEETARALLASDLSAAWVPEIQPALREMQEIKRRMVERLVEAIRAGHRKITGYSASDLMVATIPACLVTTNHILSLLASGELLIFGRHYVGARIGRPPESPLVDAKTTEATTPPKPEPILPADTAAAEVPQSTTEAQIEGAEAPQIRPPEPAEQQPEAATSQPEPGPTPPAKQVSREDLREAIDQIPPEWILEPGRTEKEIQDRIEQIAGGPVSREWMREELKARVPGKNRGRGRPRT